MRRARGYSKMNSIDDKNAKSSRRHVTLNLETDTLNYYKVLSEESGVPFQAIISLYLDECKNKKLKLDLNRL